MSIYRRRDTGGWIVDVKLEGRRIRRTLKPSVSKREAEALERQVRADLEAGPIRPNRAPTWIDLAGRYWHEHARHLGWADTVSGHMDALTDAVGENTRINMLSASRLSEAVAIWRGKGLSPGTINNRLAVARAFLNHARDVWGAPVPHIPWRRLRLETPDHIPTYVRQADRDAILALCPAHVRHAARLALATGLRRGSVLGLRWEDIDLDHGVVIAHGKSRRPGGKVLVLPVTPEIRDILEEIGPKDVGPVICWRGKPVKDIKTAFNRARAKAGRPWVLFKDFRHSVAMEILDATGSLDVAGAVLGHSSPAVTRKHYARFHIEHIRQGLMGRRRQRYLEGEVGAQKGHKAEAEDDETQRAPVAQQDRASDS